MTILPGTPATVDRLSALLERFRVHAHLFHAGPLCGVTRFDAKPGRAFLHVLRRGDMVVTHQPRSGAPRKLKLSEPTLLFYPRPLEHNFHNAPADGSDFVCATLDFDGGTRHPLVQALPPLLALKISAVEGIDQTLNLLFAETERVRRLFDVTMVEYNAKADLVEKAQMYKNCAISIGGEVAPEARVAIAQAANDLLRIQGVDASFVAVQVGNGVNVSARSMGAVNVQVIMESLGGGGHQTMAAAQLKHITPQAARSRIQDAIDQYYLSQKKTTPEARPAKGE